MKMFSYGMNCNLNEMARRCPTAICLGAAWIEDYEFVFRTHAAAFAMEFYGISQKQIYKHWID